MIYRSCICEYHIYELLVEETISLFDKDVLHISVLMQSMETISPVCVPVRDDDHTKLRPQTDRQADRQTDRQTDRCIQVVGSA